DTVLGRKDFDVIAPKTGFPSEPVYMDLAQGAGLLAPQMTPIRLYLNGNYNGMAYFTELVDEEFFTTRHRKPGNVYGIDPETGLNQDEISTAWDAAEAWLVLMTTRDPGRRDEIRGLLQAMKSSDPFDFYQYAKKHINIPEYSKYIAFDNVLG